jgi:UPF0755 protein
MKEKLLNRYKCFVLILEIVGIFILLPLFYQLIPINENANKVFYINSSNPDKIAEILSKNGYGVTAIDKFVMYLAQTPTKGWYHIKKTDINRYIFFKHLYRQKAKLMSIKIYAGDSSYELIDRLARDMKLDKNKLKAQYDKRTRFKEADIFAGKYIVARKANESTVMEYLFDISNQKLQNFIKNNFKTPPTDEELKKLLIIASIIQKETNKVNEMPIVSSVIYNRLKKGMKLQMDATLNYKNHSHTIITPQMIKEDNSRYNTYKFTGLPPTPIATITLDALYAALHPMDSDYLFFMLQRDGTHAFASTYKEHLANIKKFKLKYHKKL